jgi:hypothetical protein
MTEKLLTFVRSNLWLQLNMSDVFCWGSSFFTDLPEEDLADLYELAGKYGDVVCIAYASLKEDLEPKNYMEHCPDTLKGFDEAKAEIELLSTQDKFSGIAFDLAQRRKEIEEFGGVIEWTRGEYSRWSNFKYYLDLAFGGCPFRTVLQKGTIRGTKISAVDVNRFNVKEKLKVKIGKEISGEGSC